MGRTAHSSNMLSLKLGFVCVLFILGSEAAPKPKPAPQYGDWYINPRPAPQYADWYMNPRPAPQYGDWYMNPRPAPQYGDWYMNGNRDRCCFGKCKPGSCRCRCRP